MVGCGLALAVVLLLAFIAVISGSHSSTNTSVMPTATSAVVQSTGTQIQTPTLVLTPVATLKPIPFPRTSPVPKADGPAILGGNISAFIAKYGHPDTGCATCRSGIYNFQRYQGTQLDYLSMMLVDAAAAHKGHVNAFIVQPPPHSDWDAMTATDLCVSFGPPDVDYDQPIQVIPSPNGSSIEKVYKSAWLASQLAASDFVDRYSNTTPSPGTFAIEYGYSGSPSKVDQCSLEAGLQRL